MSLPSETAFLVLIGEKVRYLRQRQGLSQAKLAEASGYVRTSIVNLEKGRQAITLEGLFRVSCALHVNPASLMPTHKEVLAELQEQLQERMKPT